MWWWHQQHDGLMTECTKHPVSTFLALKRSTDNILGSGSIGYVTDAYRICCLASSMYFFSIWAKSDDGTCKRVPYKFTIQIRKLRNRSSSLDPSVFGEVIRLNLYFNLNKLLLYSGTGTGPSPLTIFLAGSLGHASSERPTRVPVALLFLWWSYMTNP